MAAFIAHRGPDDQHIFLNHEAEITPESPQCGFAFCRLAILDLSPRAMQPMTDGQRRLVFNGEIYNFRELRNRTRSPPPRLPLENHRRQRSHPPRLRRLGRTCVEHLNGMFAFAIWDPQNAHLPRPRPHGPETPLLRLPPGGSPSPANSPPCAAVPWSISKSIRTASPNICATGYIAAPATIYRGSASSRPPPVCHAPKPTCIRWQLFRPQSVPAADAGDADIRPRSRHRSRPPATGLRRPRRLLSLRRHRQLRHRRRHASRRRRQRPDLFHRLRRSRDTTKPPTPPPSPNISAPSTSSSSSAPMPPPISPTSPKSSANPSAIPPPSPPITSPAKPANHVKVALSGDGGDELFGGYDRYRAMALAFLRPNAPPCRPPRPSRSRIAPQIPSLPRQTPASPSAGLPDADRYAQYLALFDDPLIHELYPHQTPPPATSSAKLSSASLTLAPPCRSAAATDRVTYLPEDLLAKVDRASMLHALESGPPSWITISSA